MAIYRSDQAQFTFAAEAGKGGGPPESATGTAQGAATAINMTAGVRAGASEIVVDSTASLFGSHMTSSAEDARYIIIDFGATVANSGQTATTLFSVPEVRRVTRIEGSTNGTVHFTPPLAFPHGDNALVKGLDYSVGISTTETLDDDKMITWFPGVYDSVDCPDPDEAFDQRYVLGQNTKRNVYQMFKGQQTYTGAVAGMVLLNGFPLRFPIGKVISVPASTPTAIVAANNDTNMAIASDKGLQIFAGSVVAKVITSGVVNLPDGMNVVLGGDEGGHVNGSDIINSSCRQEIRRVVAGGSGTKANGTFVRLNYPVFFDHDPTTATTIDNRTVETGRTGSLATGTMVIKHHIIEDVQLSSVSWNVNVKDDVGTNSFQRRYFGGKIDGMTLTAEAGGLITCDWDTTTFLGMMHNQSKSTLLPTASEDVRGFGFMHDIASTDIGTPIEASGSANTKSLPTTEPYYFSEGQISLFGAVIGRVQTFSLTVSNTLEPKYYIEARGGDNRGPKEIFEGQRTYSMTATIGLPDAEASTGTTHNLFKELLQAGDHPSGTNFTALEGVDIELKFQRAGSSNDEILIEIPGDNNSTGAGTTSAVGGNNQGALLSAAPINVDGANPMEQAANFMVRDMKITITDTEKFYP